MAMLICEVVLMKASVRAETVPTITYSGHVQDIGWMNSVKGGQIAGTTGRGLRLEALKIFLKSGNQSMIKYSAHVENIGWQSWVSSGNIAGTTGKGYRMEAIRICLTGTYATKYDIYYRLHVENYGWLGWAKNGENSGTTGGGLRAEAIQIQLVTKNAAFNRGGQAYYELQQAQVVQDNYDSKVASFISTAKWKNGAIWKSNKRPTIGNGNGTGCYAYANDFIKYVFDASGSFAGTGKAFYSVNSIKDGDVIKVINSQHWFVVLYRKGSQLTTAEGNWGGKVVISSSVYSIKGNTLYRNGKKFRTFSVGYHYK